ncbi:MAG: hypothetical protein H7Y17_01625, partial [Chlorobia bacterium]|nr:hypothetical protein [Fimbriimonadaceae bacterium]
MSRSYEVWLPEGALPVLKVEDVVSFVVADEDVRDHLRRSEFQRARVGFRDYVAGYGIHDLGEITESQMFALVAARNAASLIDLLRIPRGKDRTTNKAYASYDLHRR